MRYDLRFNGNIYRALILRLLLSMFLFSLCRIGFYLFNSGFFPEMTVGTFFRLLWGGLKFDLVAVLYINMVVILMMIVPFDFRFRFTYQRVIKYIYLVLNALALAINVSDFIYYKFTLRRTTADVFKQFENEEHMGGLWLRFLFDYWYAVLFWVALVLIMAWAYKRIKVWGPQTKNRYIYYIGGGLAVPLIAFLIVAGIRGGFRHSTRPITLSNAGDYASDPKHIAIILNTPFTLIRTVGKTKVQKMNFYSAEEVERIYSPVHVPADTAAFKKNNVVVIILESFSKEFFGTFNKERENGSFTGYTPFLDSLITHSKTFDYSFANGRKSID
jgi:hypothetical protein